MEGAVKGNDTGARWTAIMMMILARQLDDPFDRLGARIAKENTVRETVGAEALGQAPGLGNLVEIGDMPKLLRLPCQGGDHVRMGMTQGVDRDPGREIEESPPVGREEISALAALESKGRAGIGRHQSIGHEYFSETTKTRRAAIECVARRRKKGRNYPRNQALVNQGRSAGVGRFEILVNQRPERPLFLADLVSFTQAGGPAMLGASTAVDDPDRTSSAM